MADPKRDEKALLIRKMFHRCVKARADTDKEWTLNEQWLVGQQRIRDKRDDDPDHVVNWLFADIFTIVPYVASRVPHLAMRAKNRDLQLVGDVTGKLITDSWVDQEIVQREEEFVLELALYGIAWWKWTWDPLANGGMGGIRMRLVPSRAMYMQEYKMLPEDCLYLFEVRRYDKISLLQRYPDKKSRINAAFKKTWGSSPPTGHVMAEDAGTGTRPSESVPSEEETTYFYDTARREGERDYVDVIECHFRDGGMVDGVLGVEDDKLRGIKSTPENTSKGRKSTWVYPKSRVVTVCGEYVLDDREEPFPGFPYGAATSYYIPGKPYSFADAQLVRGLQFGLNESMNDAAMAVKRSIGRLHLTTDPNFRQHMFTGETDESLPVTAMEDHQFVGHPRIPEAAFIQPKEYKQWISDLLGVEAGLRGDKVGDVRSGFAIERLQQASSMRMALKTRALESALRMGAKYSTHIIAKQYRVGQEIDEPLAEFVREKTNGVLDFENIAPHLFSYDIKAGINLRSGTAADVQFFQWGRTEGGMFDAEFMVDNTDVPDKPALKKRMAAQWESERLAVELKNEEMRMQIELLKQQQQGGGPPVQEVA